MERPQITSYQEVPAFIRDMVAFLKRAERGYTVKKAVKGTRRCSPALMSLLMKGERRLTPDRVDAVAAILRLTPREKQYLRDWIEQDYYDEEDQQNLEAALAASEKAAQTKEVSSHILSDWVNIYVKDAHRLPAVQRSRQQLYKLLGGLASQARIDKSLNFLLREGYLRQDLQGRIVEDVPVMVADPGKIDQKVRQFHRASLRIAADAINLYSMNERLANALVLHLNQNTYQELLELIHEFNQKLHDFVQTKTSDGDRLYQLIINLSPTGGACENET